MLGDIKGEPYLLELRAIIYPPAAADATTAAAAPCSVAMHRAAPFRTVHSTATLALCVLVCTDTMSVY